MNIKNRIEEYRNNLKTGRPLPDKREFAEFLDAIHPSTYEMVREFHQVYGHPIGDGWQSSSAIDSETFALRLSFISEEFEELIAAITEIEVEPHRSVYERFLIAIRARRKVNISKVEMADALADMEYVINGMALVLGINLPGCVREVHRSNMSKLGNDGKPIIDEKTGKILKGPNYFEPELFSYSYGWSGEQS